MKVAKEIYQYILGAVIIVGFILILLFLTVYPIPQDNKEVLYLAIGGYLTFVGAVVGYFYGSSKSSSDKNEILSDQLKKGA